jgi:hypothetical protein
MSTAIEAAIEKQASAHPCPKREKDEIVHPLRRADPLLPQHRAVGVPLHVDGRAVALLENLAKGQVHPSVQIARPEDTTRIVSTPLFAGVLSFSPKMSRSLPTRRARMEILLPPMSIATKCCFIDVKIVMT